MSKLDTRLLLCITCLIFSLNTLIAQEIGIDFFEKPITTKEELNSDNKIVSFSLVNVSSTETRNFISELFSDDEFITVFKIKENGSCYAEINKGIDPIYFREKVNPFGVHLDYSSFKVYDPTIISKDIPVDYPAYKNYDNETKDRTLYHEDVKKWISENEELWNRILKN